MKLKKFIPQLASAIAEAGFDKEPRDFQSKCIPMIKSGQSLIMQAPEGAGKSTTMVITLIQQLKRAIDDSPRAIVIATDEVKAFELEEQFKLLARQTDLRILTVVDKVDIQAQKELIYVGQDILIGTPKRIGELLNISGISTMELKFLVVDDAETVFPYRHNQCIFRIANSVQKFQCLIFANKWHDKFDHFPELIGKNMTFVKSE